MPISAGLVTPQKPGEAKITAAQNGVTSDPAASLCVECFNYTHYRQNAGWWSGYPFANYSKVGPINKSGVLLHSIGDGGCLLTVMAMALTSSGTLVDPGTLNSWLNSNSGYTPKNGIKLFKAISYPGSKIQSVSDWSIYTGPVDNITIEQLFNKCNMIIGWVTGNGSTFPTHFVLIAKIENGLFQIYDPWQFQNHMTGSLDNLLDHYTLLYYSALITN